ncbi:hypothetical protein DAMA08_039560 [Martiniozyma asiatica (nom. inval.)]|nr:hypothetical protein DAMA08_039560 [Martiniozyma asiatica]
MAINPLDEEIFDLYIEGRLSFASSRTTDAIMIFERATRLVDEMKVQTGYWHDKNVPIIMELGKCYIKENNVVKALELFNKALKIDPSNAKILWKKMEYYASVMNDDEALKVLETGVEYIKPEDPLLPNINNELKRLAKSQNTSSRVKRICSKNTNLLKQLPVEVIICIMNDLDQYSLINCLKTCREWRSTLLTIPELLGRFTLRKNITLAQFESYLCYLRDFSPLNEINLPSMSLNTTRKDEKAIFKKLLASGLTIQKLEVNFYQVNNFEIVRLTQKTQSQLFQNVKELTLLIKPTPKGNKTIEPILEICHSLKSLTITVIDFQKTRDDPYFKIFPKIEREFKIGLEKLDLNVGNFKEPKFFVERFFGYFMMPHLKSLNIFVSSFSKESLASIFECCTIVNSFSIQTFNPFNKFLTLLASSEIVQTNFKCLKNLKFNRLEQGFEDDLNSSGPVVEFSSLNSFELYGEAINFGRLIQFLSKSRNIKFLKLSNWKYGGVPITNFSIRQILDSLPKLQRLSIFYYPLNRSLNSMITEYNSISTSNDRNLKYLETDSRIIITLLGKIEGKIKVDLLVYHGWNTISEELDKLKNQGYIGEYRIR